MHNNTASLLAFLKLDICILTAAGQNPVCALQCRVDVAALLCLL